MMKHRLKTRAKVVGLLAASTAMLTFATVAVQSPAGADPTSKTAYVGVGSDTIQDLFNAFSGASPYDPPSSTPATFYTPLASSTATNSKTVVSWDAIEPVTGSTSSCITPKTGFPTIDRPNGSGDGQKALSRSIDGGDWHKSGACGAGAGNVAGSIDFARSSSGPSSSFPGTTLTYIPFARDGVSYAFVDKDGSNDFINGLSSAQLKGLYGTGNVPSTGKIVVNGQTVNACMVQGGSGTGKFWDTAMGNNGTGTTAHASAVASGCNATVDYEENGANSFLASAFVAAMPANQDAVIPFSAGSWISQANTVALDRSATARGAGVDIGAIDALGKPYSGTDATSEAPSATFYGSTTYGRDLYVVVPTAKVPVAGGDAGLKSLFRGTGSAICSAAAQATDLKFGFSFPPVGGCGTTGNPALQSGLVS